MSESLNVQTIVFGLDDTASGWQGNAVVGNVYKVPTAAFGGRIRILEAYYTNQAATTSGTAFSLTLLNYDTAGTAVKSSGGTVASTIGGTANPFSAGVPVAFTLVNPVMEAGEWLVLSKAETNSSDPTRGILTINYMNGG